MGGILQDNLVLSTDNVNSPPWRVSKANVLGVSPSSKRRVLSSMCARPYETNVSI